MTGDHLPAQSSSDPRPVYLIILKLTPTFSQQLAFPGVVEAIASAASQGRAPAVEELVALGQAADFARVFVERLDYLLRLKRAGILRAAGPFEGLKEGLYLCQARDATEARSIMENDPLYRAGYIEREFIVHRWLVAI